MRVTILGSSAMFETVDRACSGYLVDLGSHRIWMDAGGGTWRHLVAAMDHSLLDGIIVTHRHPDHSIDVFQAMHARLYGGPEPLPPIPLWGPKETLDLLFGYADNITESFELLPVAAGDTFEVGDARIDLVGMAHPPETIGVRLQTHGATLAYSADTGPTADFDALARAADVFLCEATFQDSDGSWEGHMSAAQAGEIAGRVGARTLVLTHLPPGRDHGLSLEQAHRDAGDVDVRLAEDGLVLEVGA